MADFDAFFKDAMGSDELPYSIQREFSLRHDMPHFVHVPTGCGKTAMVTLGWLWRRRFAAAPIQNGTPRRLVYCLPMRTLVTQTRDNAILWLDRLGLLGGQATWESGSPGPRLKSYAPDWSDASKISVSVLMGGEDADDWDLHPERDAIVVGTQDMLLSRALNRGYGMSRFRWPTHFGMLNNDCLWVFDEVQIMGSGLASAAQMQAFRRNLGVCGHVHSLWMSATLQPDWLATVDFKPFLDGFGECETFKLERRMLDKGRDRHLLQILDAKKPLCRARASMGEAESLAGEVGNAHRPASRTLVVLNTVKRAAELHRRLTKRHKREGSFPKPVLLHSRFRPPDRDAAMSALMAAPPPEGAIVVSTQVVEAGVDISAETLFTEVAPWPSLVQRFGRCNRRGEDDATARAFWIDLPQADKERAKVAPPYAMDELEQARNRLATLQDAGPSALPEFDMPFQHRHVVRRKDVVELFDTTPDLAGNDLDIDRFVRDAEETDVRVFWRCWPGKHGIDAPPENEPAPRRDEMCPAPAGEFRKFAKKNRGLLWRWDYLEKKWAQTDQNRIAPGQVYLAHTDAGGYGSESGWTGRPTDKPEPIPPLEHPAAPLGYDDDENSQLGIWQTIANHTDDVCAEMDAILRAVPVEEADALRLAARWHDRGKAHEVFVKALPEGSPTLDELWGKAPQRGWRRYLRKHFRHELASALSALDPASEGIPAALRGLVAYLVAAHHGKVRLSIRSLPGEETPTGNGGPRRYARGVCDGDTLPATDLGGGTVAPPVLLSLEPMELGLCQCPPFEGQPSWAERMLNLRDALGPFRLAYLEGLLRAADMRASQRAASASEQKEANDA